jgi:hypothetical protein
MRGGQEEIRRKGNNGDICCNYISAIRINGGRRDSNREEKEKERKYEQEKGRCDREEKKNQ